MRSLGNIGVPRERGKADRHREGRPTSPPITECFLYSGGLWVVLHKDLDILILWIQLRDPLYTSSPQYARHQHYILDPSQALLAELNQPLLTFHLRTFLLSK